MYQGVKRELGAVVKVYGITGPWYAAIGTAFKRLECKALCIGNEGIESDAHLRLGLKCLEQLVAFIGLKYLTQYVDKFLR
jgi:hypothetical protein